MGGLYNKRKLKCLRPTIKFSIIESESRMIKVNVYTQVKILLNCLISLSFINISTFIKLKQKKRFF